MAGLYLNYGYVNQDGDQYQFNGKDPYTFSDDLNRKLKDSNVTDVVSNPGYKDPDVKIEEQKQLLIFIRNFDQDGNLIESPANCVETKIDIYERKIEKYYWYEAKTNENGSINIEETEFKEKTIIKEDPTPFIEEDISGVNAHIISETTFLSAFFRDYYGNYKELSGINNKKFSLVIHNSTDEYKYYDSTFNTELMSILISHNYYSLEFDLDKHSFHIDENKIYDFEKFSLSNAKLVLSSTPGFTIKADNFVFDSVEIDVKTTATPYISVTYKNNVKFSYITFTNGICYFSIAGKEEDPVKWLNQSVDVYGLTVETPKINYDDVLEYILRIKNTNAVTITGFTLKVANFNMGAIRVENGLSLKMNTCNFGSTKRFEKSLVSIESVSDISVCGCYAGQDVVQKDRSYIFAITKNDTLSSQSYVSVSSTNFGLFSFVEDYSGKVSFYSCKSDGSIHPINYQKSSIAKISVTKCQFTNIEELEIQPNAISIFDSYLKCNKISISALEKIFISNSTVDGKESNLISQDSTNVYIEGSTILGTKFIVNGNGGSAIFKMKGTKFIAETCDIISLNKGSVENVSFECEEFSLSGASISSFNPIFENNKLKKISLSGKISNSIFLLGDSNPRKLVIEESNMKGVVGFVFTSKVGDISLSVDNAIVTTAFDYMNGVSGSSDISLSCNNECRGSVIYSLKDNLKISPKAEGSFNDLKLINSNMSLNEIKRSSEYKNKIAYGKIDE